MLRIGFFVGFLFGAGVASMLAAETPEPSRPAAEPLPATDAAEEQGPTLLERIKQRFREAKAAGKEAAAEKEAELRSDFERSVNKRFYP